MPGCGLDERLIALTEQLAEANARADEWRNQAEGGGSHHWNKLYRAECLQRQDDVARIGAEREAAEARAAQMFERTKGLTFNEFRSANVARCLKWHPQGIASWSASDWLTAVTGELGELASLLKMRNRERDGLPGNKFSPTNRQVADELADVLTYLDLLAAMLGVDLGLAAAKKFNEVSERVGFPDRIALQPEPEQSKEKEK